MVAVIALICWAAVSFSLLWHGIGKALDWSSTVDAFAHPAFWVRHVVAVETDAMARMAVGAEVFCGIWLLIERSRRASLAAMGLLIVFTATLVVMGLASSWHAPCPCSADVVMPIWMAIARNGLLLVACWICCRRFVT